MGARHCHIHDGASGKVVNSWSIFVVTGCDPLRRFDLPTRTHSDDVSFLTRGARDLITKISFYNNQQFTAEPGADPGVDETVQNVSRQMNLV